MSNTFHLLKSIAMALTETSRSRELRESSIPRLPALRKQSEWNSRHTHEWP